MGIQETVRRQEEKLAVQAQQKQQSPSMHPQTMTPQLVVDLEALRHMIEDVVRTELQTIRVEQSVQQVPQQQPMVDVQALQHAVQMGVRAELQTVQTTLTLLTQAVQAQTEAMISDETEEEGEEDDLLPTAAPRRTDDAIEDEQVYPPDDDEEDLDDVGEEENEGGGAEDNYPRNPPRPESPTHRLRPSGPQGFLLGDGVTGRHPAEGTRRWEPYYEQ